MVVNVDFTAQPLYLHAGKLLVHTEWESERGRMFVKKCNTYCPCQEFNHDSSVIQSEVYMDYITLALPIHNLIPNIHSNIYRILK